MNEANENAKRQFQVETDNAINNMRKAVQYGKYSASQEAKDILNRLEKNGDLEEAKEHAKSMIQMQKKIIEWVEYLAKLSEPQES